MDYAKTRSIFYSSPLLCILFELIMYYYYLHLLAGIAYILGDSQGYFAYFVQQMRCCFGTPCESLSIQKLLALFDMQFAFPILVTLTESVRGNDGGFFFLHISNCRLLLFRSLAQRLGTRSLAFEQERPVSDPHVLNVQDLRVRLVMVCPSL